MHTVVSLPQSTRAPRKSSSYATLRRDKQQTNTDPPSSYYSSRPTYLDSYPTSQRSTNFKSTATTSKFSSTSFDFHSFPSTEDFDSSSTVPNPFPRERSRTGPSSQNPNWIDRSISPRISVTSTLTEGTSPDTPVDNASFRDFDVLVAAPVSGVEMMDALVDGMNGGEEIGLSSRSRFGIPNHHPLYQPPLPTPPPGVVLGGGKSRRQKKPPKLVHRSSFSDQDDDQDNGPPTATPKRRRPFLPGRSTSNTTITLASPSSRSPQSSAPPTPIDTESSLYTARPRTAPSTPSSADKRRSLAPSISDIIRAHAPQEAQARARASPLNRAPSYSRSVGHTTVREESEPEPEPITAEEEADLLSRSSIDSIADEVRRTLRHQVSMKHVAHPPPPPHRHSYISDSASIISPRSDGCGTASLYSSSIASSQPPLSPFDTGFMSKPTTPSQAVAQYLRSTRLTTLLKLTRSPHASHDNPLTVSLSDLGSQNGFPVLVFLGLGCVRHVMGLYDEMAQCLGLRLITIDRWGLGRTEPRAKSAKGIIQWASVVEEVLDRLHIDECSVMAHSAGAPYALSFANKLPHRIRGEICLLAPWVGESAGYKWLKYVPNGILKTAQAAEWKLQTWMIGKPPTLAWEGIGYTQQAGKSSSTSSPGSSSVYSESYPRPSLASSSFSAYDDLRDFDGRFESMSTLGTAHPNITQCGNNRNESKMQVTRKSSRGILGRLKSTPQSPSVNDQSPPSTGKRLKALRSMGSLKSKTSPSSSKKQQSLPSPQLPISLKVDVSLGLDDTTWPKSFNCDSSSVSTPEKFPRSGSRRSLSLSSSSRPFNTQSLPPSPNPPSSHDLPSSSSASELPSSPNNAFQAAVGNALIAASHSESAKGTHNDLLQILNHDHHPWGFSYEAYPHKVQVWYGDRDEKIAENAVRWMEKTMGEGMCSVRVVKGADHGLMYKSGVVVDVLEYLLSFWH
ncbi:hypothetical protein C8R41DRAFT_763922 [Lentinula lateritia]|uniref:Alpha/beta-hydrolase n=1 Tax=Lentinula lateritia TaxID=40482 RepID=A0ABQ8VHA7_9AGAR|nr:hypothetical protein C8R41DRAFT_763922 [Lentinula lateritia]